MNISLIINYKNLLVPASYYAQLLIFLIFKNSLLFLFNYLFLFE